MWDAFFEQLRHGGRSGSLFFLIIAGTAIAAFFGPVGLTVLLGVLGIFVVRTCVEIRQQQDRFDKLGRLPPLASVDLRVARTKLANSKTQRLMAEQAQRLKTQRLSARPASTLRLRPR